ncbi:MAG: hypothetical protein Kilf2KO_37220 [Rhodospirillales bacterium]
MRRPLDRAGQREGVRRNAWQDLRWLLPLVGLLLFMPPFLGLFDHRLFVFGLPLLLVYIFATWLGGIVLTALVARRESAVEPPDSGEA